MTHSEWIDCPMVKPGDDKTQTVRPVTCRYCREHLGLKVETTDTGTNLKTFEKGIDNVQSRQPAA